MKQTAKAMLVTGGLLAVAATTLVGTGMASAHSAMSQDTLVSKIAQKFGLQESEVKAVFDEDRASHEADMKASMETRLTQAVTDGKITEEQKTQILAKLDELQTFRASLEGKTEAEKRDAMKAKMDELRTWAQENNIPKRYFMMRGGMGEGHGHHGKDMMGDDTTANDDGGQDDTSGMDSN